MTEIRRRPGTKCHIREKEKFPCLDSTYKKYMKTLKSEVTHSIFPFFLGRKLQNEFLHVLWHGDIFQGGVPKFFFRSLIRLQCTFPIFPLSQISDRYRGDYSRQTIRENRATTYEHIFKYLPSGIDSTIENINKTSSLLFPNTKCRYHRFVLFLPSDLFFFAAGLLIKRRGLKVV